MPAAELPTATPDGQAAKRAPAPAMGDAFARIAELRAAGFELIYPAQPTELARLVRGRELVIVCAGKEPCHGRS